MNTNTLTLALGDAGIAVDTDRRLGCTVLRLRRADGSTKLGAEVMVYPHAVYLQTEAGVEPAPLDEAACVAFIQCRL